ISDIVLKLLQKMPEHRYQTAEALSADLEEARRQWRARGAVVPFDLGARDVPHRLYLEGRVHGRDAEKAELARAFDPVAGGAREVFFVIGRSGIGKSALVREVEASIAGRCRWLAGKCDLLQGNLPHAPIAAAMSGLVSSLLALPAGELASARERVREAVS